MALPLLSVLATRPALVAEHLEGYASLLTADLTQCWLEAKRKVWLEALAMCGLLLALGLAGVSTMLWAIQPASLGGSPWLLVFVPVVPAILGLGCLLVRKPANPGALESTRRQLEADLALLRETGSR